MDQQNLRKTSALAPIGQLFSDSWTTFTHSVLQLLLLGVLTIVIYLVVGFSGFITLVFTGISSTLFQKGTLGAGLTPATLTTLGILGVIFFLVFLIVSAALQITSILIVADNGQASFGSKFRKSFGFIIPLFLINLVTGFLTLGGFFLLFIPAIILAILFSFVQFEVILNNQKGLFSIKRSVAIISKNFGGIFVRYLLLFLIYIGIYILTSILNNLVGNDGKVWVSILSFIVNYCAGWYSLSFSVNLYKQAKATVSDNQVGNIVWIWIISLLGWLIAIGLFAMGWKAVSSGIFNNLTPKTQAPLATSMQNSVKQMSPEAKAHFDKSAELFKQIQANKNDPTAVKKLNDQNIAELKQAAELDPNNAQIWYELGNAYTWVSSTGTLNDILVSYQKAATLDPQNTIYIDNVADALTNLGRYDEAVLQLQNSMRIAQARGLGDSGLTHYRLGLAYMGLKIYDSARENFNQAIDILSKENKDGSFDSYILQAQKELSSMPK